ncbi:39S ribosomal protein L3, mitochondrial-like [Varroa jacobsoni]|uniref:Large ribosomal subunit protein uL3m n=1 Tax=Varroa destructor TaxID=109461 RepID=A0A7M7M8H8_VARDE|nr:39S ribosomal protein L3, mitochondrial-like [Varroa destructor]XP_022686624.1 39S ribosomal protein L3, mitochondrial-like [Varroa jacobsoni]
MSGLLARVCRTSFYSGSIQRYTAPAIEVIPIQLGATQQQLIVRGKSTKPKRRKVHPFHWWVRKHRAEGDYEDYLTKENKSFLLEEAQKTYLAPNESPLREEPWPLGQWTEGVRRTGIIARKIGVQPMWTNDGKRVLSTLLQVCDQNVLDFIKSEDFAHSRFGFKSRGYGALIVGADSRLPFRYTQAYLDLFKKAGCMPKKKITRFLISDSAAIQPGTPLFAGHFRPGDWVNVYGKTIDKGFMGAVKRWGLKGNRATHGCTKSHNRAGSMGSRGRVLKGRKMPGHEGNERKLCAGLKVWRINHQHNVIWVHGPAVPGPTNAFVYIYDSLFGKKAPTAENPPPFPTYYPDPENPLPVEVYDKDFHRHDDSSIVLEEEQQVKRELKVKAKMKSKVKAGGKKR